MQGGAQSGSSPAGGGGGVYTPTAQPAADQMYQDITRSLFNAGGGPAATNYPTGQSFVDQYITGSPYAGQALQGSQIAAEQMGGFYPYQTGAGYNLLGGGNNALTYGNMALQQGFSPLYQQITDYTQQNPYFGLALSGASQAANIGGQGANNLQNPIYAGLDAASPLLAGGHGALDRGNQVWGAAGPVMDFAKGVADKSGSVWDASRTVANTAFDPQSALFHRTQDQMLDQQGAINARSGIAGTPYGAGITGDAMRNFDIDWQNNQLGRQQAGLGALNTGLNASATGLGALGQGLGALNTGAGAYNSGLGAYGGALGQYGNAMTSALGNLGGSAQLGASTAGMPSSTYTNQLGNILKALQAQQGGATQGAGAYGSLLGSAGSAYTGGAGLQNNALSHYLSATQQPYNTGLGIANNALSGLSNATNLGSQQYALPQSVLNALSAYMHLGQGASGISGTLGNLGFNQTAQGLGGMIGGANSLLGSNSLLGGSSGIFGGGGALGGLGSLFGGGGAALDMAGVAQTGAGLGAATGLDLGTLAMIGLI